MGCCDMVVKYCLCHALPDKLFVSFSEETSVSSSLTSLLLRNWAFRSIEALCDLRCPINSGNRAIDFYEPIVLLSPLRFSSYGQ